MARAPQQCREAIAKVRPGVGIYTLGGRDARWSPATPHTGPCLFPQHSPRKKHERRIALEPWQQEIVDDYPWEFIRGLIHSDGCRITNWTTRLVAGERKRYEYPRYFFTNVSEDIRRLCTDTLEKLGIDWTYCTRNGVPFNISIARKASVARMDLHVGPKH